MSIGRPIGMAGQDFARTNPDAMPITQAQRSRIRRLIDKHEFDRRTITYQYRRIRVPDSWHGSRVDSWLDSLTLKEASITIDRLEAL